MEIAIWAVLDEAERQTATRRVTALQKFENEGDWARRSLEADVSRPRFFSMLREWRKNRSLTSVVPLALGRRKRAAGASANTALRERARELLIRSDKLSGGSPDDLSPSDEESERELSRRKLIAELGRCREGAGRSEGLLGRVLDMERAALGRERLGGDAGLGRHLVLDASPMSVRAGKGETDITALTGYVIDEATTLILGHAVGTDPIAVVQAAARAAAEFADCGLDIPVAGSEHPSFTIVLGGDVMAMMREVGRLAEPVRDMDLSIVTDRRERAMGSRLMQILGLALGPLDFRPRATFYVPRVVGGGTPSASSWPPDPIRIVAALVANAVARHNAEVLSRGLVAAVPPGRIANDLRRLLEATAASSA